MQGMVRMPSMRAMLRHCLRTGTVKHTRHCVPGSVARNQLFGRVSSGHRSCVGLSQPSI